MICPLQLAFYSVHFTCKYVYNNIVVYSYNIGLFTIIILYSLVLLLWFTCLQAASERCKLSVPLSTLGPSVVIFHETQHTDILGQGSSSPAQQPRHSSAASTQPDLLPYQASSPAASLSVSQVEDGFEMYSSATSDVFEASLQPTVEEEEEEDRGGSTSTGHTHPTTTEPAVMSAEELLRIRWMTIIVCSYNMYMYVYTYIAAYFLEPVFSSVQQWLGTTVLRLGLRQLPVDKICAVINYVQCIYNGSD